MAQRLSIAREAGSGSLLLSDVPRPDKLQAGTCCLIRALWATLIHAGAHTDYDTLMGLTGIAFELPAEEDFVVPAGDGLRCRHVAEALAALGLTARCVSLVPDAPDAVVAAVEEGLRSGFAVPVLGWPEEGDDWGVITGSDPGRGVICGWPARPSTRAYLGAPPRGIAAVIITGRREPTAFCDALHAALQRVLESAGAVDRTHQQWAGLFSGDTAQARWSEGAEALILRHEKVWDDVADARTSAAVFLESASVAVDDIAGDWLLQASEHAAAVVAQLGLRHPAIGDIVEVADALRSEQWRSDWLALLEAIARHEQDMRRCIRDAISGAPPPGPEW